MEILVKREKFHAHSTGGQMYINGVPEYWTCEDSYREIDGQPVSEWKIKGDTAIPKGRYQVIIDFSNRFSKYLPHILNVPGFEGIRIHSGNTSRDTEGCILIGMEHDGESIGRSRDAMMRFTNQLQDALKDGEVWIEII